MIINNNIQNKSNEKINSRSESKSLLSKFETSNIKNLSLKKENKKISYNRNEIKKLIFN